MESTIYIVLVIVHDYCHIVHRGTYQACKEYGKELPKELEWAIYGLMEYHSGDRFNT